MPYASQTISYTYLSIDLLALCMVPSYFPNSISSLIQQYITRQPRVLNTVNVPIQGLTRSHLINETKRTHSHLPRWSREMAA